MIIAPEITVRELRPHQFAKDWIANYVEIEAHRKCANYAITAPGSKFTSPSAAFKITFGRDPA